MFFNQFIAVQAGIKLASVTHKAAKHVHANQHARYGEFFYSANYQVSVHFHAKVKPVKNVRHKPGPAGPTHKFRYTANKAKVDVVVVDLLGDIGINGIIMIAQTHVDVHVVAQRHGKVAPHCFRPSH